MLSPGYYAVHRDAYLVLGSKRTRLRKHDWLITDGEHVGVFDKTFTVDWVPLEWSSGQPVILTDEVHAQVEAVASPTSYTQLARRFSQQLDTEDGTPIPDMPRPPKQGLGQYLRAPRTLLAYSYGH